MTYYAYIGSDKIALPEGINNAADAQNVLKRTHPEVKNATISTKTDGENTIFEFKPKAGRKG